VKKQAYIYMAYLHIAKVEQFSIPMQFQICLETTQDNIIRQVH